MAMRQMARCMAARVFAAGGRSTSVSGTGIGSGATTRRFFCTKEELPLPKPKPKPKPGRDLLLRRESIWDRPPRRESFWAEMKEWRGDEWFVAVFGSVTATLYILAWIDVGFFVREVWRFGGFKSSDPTWDEED